MSKNKHIKNRDWGVAPDKNTTQWKKNESLIAKNPVLRNARDVSEGFKPSSGITSYGFGDAYDQIDWSKKDDSKKNYRVKINGRYVDEEDE